MRIERYSSAGLIITGSAGFKRKNLLESWADPDEKESVIRLTKIKILMARLIV